MGVSDRVVTDAFGDAWLDLAALQHPQQGAQVGGMRAVLAVAVKDALIFVAWLNGFFERKVLWRGRWLKVGPGSRLLSAPHPLDPAHETSS